MDLPGIIRTLQQKQNNRAAEPVSAQHLSISTLDGPITPPTNCKIGFIQGQKLANQAKMSLEHVVRFLIQNIILFCFEIYHKHKHKMAFYSVEISNFHQLIKYIMFSQIKKVGFILKNSSTLNKGHSPFQERGSS